jgi:hypothetical protein
LTKLFVAPQSSLRPDDLEARIRRELDAMWDSLNGKEVALARSTLAELVEKIEVAPDRTATLYPKQLLQ